jgi:Protein of unknown function (DUF1566)
MNATPKLKRILAALLLGSPLMAAAAPFTVSIDGTEVTDRASGLIWQRCAEGMTYVISCNGSAARFTHEAALTHARDHAGAVGWRLPNIKELASIVDRTRSSPSIDPTAFPGTPVDYFWSSTPFNALPGAAWSIYFSDGSVNNADRRVALGTTLLVRLVRTGAQSPGRDR